MYITPTIELNEHLGSLEPKEPWTFARKIEANQDVKPRTAPMHTILFNKGRYFETSFHDKKLCEEIASLIDSPVKYNNMIVDSWRKLEDFVIAMNCFGIYVSIKVDWI